MRKLFFTHLLFVAILFIAPSGLLAQAPVKAGAAAAKPALSAEQKKEIEAIVREYLLKNPAIVREAMAALEQQEEKERLEHVATTRKARQKDIYSDPDSPIAGNPKGDVTIVVFFDYFCGYCKKTLPALDTLLAKDASLRVVYKEFPIITPQSRVAARAALAANRQGKYAEFHRALIKATTASDAEIKSISDRLGLNYATLRKDMDDPKITGEILRNQDLADAIGIGGTPAYLIGDVFIPGAIDAAGLTKFISDERIKRKNAVAAK